MIQTKKSQIIQYSHCETEAAGRFLPHHTFNLLHKYKALIFFLITVSQQFQVYATHFQFMIILNFVSEYEGRCCVILIPAWNIHDLGNPV